MENKIPYIYSSIDIHPSLVTVDLTISTRNTAHRIEKVLWSDVAEFIEDLKDELEMMLTVRDELKKHRNSSTSTKIDGDES